MELFHTPFLCLILYPEGWPTLSAEQDVKQKKFSNYDKETNED
jgi:hypothetical protein